MRPIRRFLETDWLNRSYDLEELRERAFAKAERIAERAMYAVIATAVVLVAAWLTPSVVEFFLGIAWRLPRVGLLLWKAWEQPWVNWVAFPFVLAALGFGAWYLIEKDLRRDGRGVRGRTVLSSEEARKVALRQLHRPERERRARREFKKKVSS